MAPRTNQRIEVDPRSVPADASDRVQAQFALAQQHQAAVHAHRRRYARGAGNALALTLTTLAMSIIIPSGWSIAWAFASGAFFILGITRLAVSQGIELNYQDPPIPKGLEVTDDDE